MASLMRWSRVGVVSGLLVLGALGVASADHDKGDPVRVHKPTDVVKGGTLTDWTLAYWRWFVEGADPATAWSDHVYFPQLPQASVQFNYNGCTHFNGLEDISLPEGSTLYMPVAAFTFERYQDGSVDGPQPESLLTDHASVSIDGKDITPISDYFVQGTFSPEIIYAQPTSYGSVATESVMAVGFLTRSLDQGVHTIHVIDDLCQTGAYFDNVFTLTITDK